MSKNPPRLTNPNSLIQLYGLPTWYLKAFGWLVTTVFALIALGGSVRIMNAGLACPDWPLCFGDVIPDYHPQVYFEFIHRVLAGFVAIATFTLQIMLMRSQAPKKMKWLAAGSLALLMTQVVFGGLTVLLQLHSKVVAAHLGMGTGFFAILTWMYLSLKPVEKESLPNWIKGWSALLLASVYGQIILGGLVASHFASLVCTDFPKCQGQWFPTFSGIVGLHLIHRLGAYTIFALALANLVLMRKKLAVPRLKSLSTGMFAMVCTQVLIGIANVLYFTPPLIAVAHLAMATAVLAVAVRQVHFATR